MINIKAIGKKKKNGDGSTTKFWGVGFANGNITVENDEVQGVNIWGQYHDHSGDVNGDMQVDGNINSTGNLNANSANITTNLTVGGDIDCSGVNATDVNATNVNSTSMTTDYLTVTKQAHFFNLTIDEVKAAGGQIILSAANATVDGVVEMGSEYMVVFRKDDGTKYTVNPFKVNDQVLCQTFNLTDELGTVANKYYWSLVSGIGETTITNEDGEEIDYNYITLSRNTYDGTSVPEVGDKIVQLGYRGNDDSARQSAIILSAYKSPDPNVTAPAITQYAGINTFSLDGKIVNQMSPNNNTFTGNFRVVNGNTTTNIIDLINGQQPQIVTDSQQSWIMADSSSKTYAFTDYQNLPTNIKVYLGNDLIPYSEWTSGSTVVVGNRTYRLVDSSFIPSEVNGINITAVTKNTNDVVLTWSYKENLVFDTDTQTNVNQGTTVSNTNVVITVNFTHNGTPYTIQKTVPMNVIKASVTTQGADAELDKLMVDKFDLTVTLENKLTADIDAKVYHIKGKEVTRLTDLTDYTANVLLSNNSTVTLTKTTSFTKSGIISENYTGMTNPPTSATFKLYKSNVLVDEVTASIKFAAGSIFDITNNAISAAVQQSNGYTDNKVAQVQMTADGLTSRVTAIENDYVTQSELTQTADNIQLNVYDELKNKTGIDVSAGQITLNGNTVINGNLTLTESEQGFTLVGDGGYTQILPKSIGTYNEFTSQTTTTMPKLTKANGVETGENPSEGRIVFTFTSTFNVGTVKSGSTITVAPVSRSYWIYMATGLVNINAYTRETSETIEFIEDGQVQSAQTWTDNQVTYTTQGGNLSIRCKVVAGIYSTTFNYSREPWQEITINVTLPIEDAFTLIGNDGIAMTFGSRKNIYMGADGAIFRYGQYGMMVDDTGVWVNESGHWYSLADYITMYSPHT